MRCPKCGYLSFDHLEICRGCRKNIAKFSQDLTGVVFLCEVPDFLGVEAEEEVQDTGDEAAAGETAEAVEEFEAEAELEDTVEFSPDDADPRAPEEPKEEIEFALPDAAEEQTDEIAFELPGEEEVSAAGKQDDSNAGIEMSLADLGGLELENASGPDKAVPEPSAKSKAGSKRDELSSLDLGGLDFSEPTPTPTPAESKEGDFSIGELSLEAPEPVRRATEKDGKSAAPPVGAARSGLPDLGLEGFDLAPTASAVAAAGKKEKTAELKAATKTGTALDDFNFDLGDLMAGQVEKPTKPAAVPAKAAPGTKKNKKG